MFRVRVVAEATEVDGLLEDTVALARQESTAQPNLETIRLQATSVQLEL